jgi:rubrerythrin
MLKRRGFREAYSMEGGIRAWKGLVAVGFPEVGAAYFYTSRTIADFISLSWFLEEGTRMFYLRLTDITDDARADELWKTLIDSEEKHKSSLRDLYGKVTGEKFEPEGDPERGEAIIMEGGVAVDGAVEWARNKDLKEILELSISLEAISYDRYLHLSTIVDVDETRGAFRVLAREEKKHLERLTALFDDTLGG